MSDAFMRLALKGEPYDVGYQHGARLASAVADNVEVYFTLFQHYAGLDREAVLGRASDFVRIIGAFDEDLLTEIRGIAKGSGKSLEEIVALNSRTEIMFKAGARLLHGECTSMAATPEAALSQHTLIAQNWDWMPRIQRNCVLLDLERRGKPRVLTFTEAGFVGKIGMNGAGLGFCCNLLVTPQTRPGIPFHILCRRILDSSSIGEALGVLMTSDSGASGNFLIAHAEGEAVDIEKTPSGTDYLYGAAGVLAHTNHFESRLTVEDEGRKLLPDSILRYCRARKLLDRSIGEVEVSTLQSILRDHVNRPSSICRHPDLRVHELERLQTNASIVMDLNDGVMFICKGQPCAGQYQIESLNESAVEPQMLPH
ncbi:MAG TPA: C45 family peptidase [Candidatus Binataceae bacterium]|nr:C45 family peptidase [Candidatus Binataceae bacterium]